ncbi:MAG: hypothetical protein V7651_01780 [Hyphomonas oceanitis]|uniref:hypothetical protein n=1 Tax=Hyphomonas oceanitis TaxID=81033 RepID=UPI003000FBD0
MPRITMKQDNLNERNKEFVQAPLEQPVFLNSVPKCGTHLIRNIMRMFVPVEQQYHDTFLQIPNLRGHLRALSPEAPKISWGHMLFSDDSAMAISPARHILLVRDPYSWVIARARFFLSENFDGGIGHLRSDKLEPEVLMNLMIFGIHGKAPELKDIFTFNAAAWLGTHARLYRYEDMVQHLKDINSLRAEQYFTQLLNDCGIAVPDDWRERVIIGSDKAQSSTSRDNLDVDDSRLPDVLPDAQKKLVDYAVPGLRALLGYA